MKKILFTCVILLTFFSTNCQQQKIAGGSKIQQKTILFDRLSKPAAILVWYDKYYDEHSIKPCGVYNQKKYGLIRELQIEEPTLFVLPIGIQVPYLIYQNDTVIFYDKGKFVSPKAGNPTLKHRRLQQRTNELRFFEEVFDSLGACYGGHSYSVPGELQTYIDVINYQKNKLINRVSFLERKNKQTRISQKFYEYANTYFQYKFYDDVFAAFKTKKFFEVTKKNEIMRIADSLICELNDKEPLNYSWYKSIMNYVELKLNDIEINYNNFDSCLNQSVINLKGKVKNFAAFYFYKYVINYRETGFINLKIESLKLHCTDEDYISYISGYTSLTKSIAKKNGNSELTDVILNPNKEKEKLSQLIGKFNGKVIYIDFWASWCIPCLEEIPFSKKLIEQFKSKDVVFIFLSIDLNTSRWLDALKRNEMLGYGIQYLVIDIENNHFIQKYNVGPIPRYILINKKGDVIDPDAPRPSENKTKERIMQLLESE